MGQSNIQDGKGYTRWTSGAAHQNARLHELCRYAWLNCRSVFVVAMYRPRLELVLLLLMLFKEILPLMKLEEFLRLLI